ncbi:hypothetical protein Dsin_016784 [Dipteronia sinensis]|uniref:Uncharacterized protein n=1 Tax=Dipteronia sinensis TaxID=43782 RepID=A0AAE0E7A7_9ROSI|nr:hypothetical protein Dsin_016784 [Dipteronia sinensis]
MEDASGTRFFGQSRATLRPKIERIKGLLPKVISPTQSAFVEGRKITDNVLLAQKLLINYHMKTGKRQASDFLELNS